MSPSEELFVRTYVQALQRECDLISSVFDLMNPQELGVENIVNAVRIADALDLHYAQFLKELRRATHDKKQVRRLYRRKSKPDIAVLSELFSLSFFTMAVSASGAFSDTTGWFSGDPETWPEILATAELKDISKTIKLTAAGKDSALTKIAKKFFGGNLLFIKQIFDSFVGSDVFLDQKPPPSGGDTDE